MRHSLAWGETYTPELVYRGLRREDTYRNR